MGESLQREPGAKPKACTSHQLASLLPDQMARLARMEA